MTEHKQLEEILKSIYLGDDEHDKKVFLDETYTGFSEAITKLETMLREARADRKPNVDLNDFRYDLKSVDDPIERFNIFITKWCVSVPHLLDSDENDGETIRETIATLPGEVT